MIATCDLCGTSAECELCPDGDIVCQRCLAASQANLERLWALADAADEAARQGRPLTVVVETVER